MLARMLGVELPPVNKLIHPIHYCGIIARRLGEHTKREEDMVDTDDFQYTLDYNAYTLTSPSSFNLRLSRSLDLFSFLPIRVNSTVFILNAYYLSPHCLYPACFPLHSSESPIQFYHRFLEEIHKSAFAYLLEKQPELPKEAFRDKRKLESLKRSDSRTPIWDRFTRSQNDGTPLIGHSSIHNKTQHSDDRIVPRSPRQRLTRD